MVKGLRGCSFRRRPPETRNGAHLECPRIVVQEEGAKPHPHVKHGLGFDRAGAAPHRGQVREGGSVQWASCRAHKLPWHELPWHEMPQNILPWHSLPCSRFDCGTIVHDPGAFTGWQLWRKT
jgi:hypothetical protein